MPFPIEMDGSAEFRFESLFAGLAVNFCFLPFFCKVGFGVWMAAIGTMTAMQATALSPVFQVDFREHVFAVRCNVVVNSFLHGLGSKNYMPK
jgi:hypothetical protein